MKTLLASLTVLLLGLGLAAAATPYPSKMCLVTDNELGSMGKVVTMVYEGQQVKFCCKPCVKKFNANPAKYLAKLK
jgi:uncharacterized UBP type Zn finger protein